MREFKISPANLVKNKKSHTFPPVEVWKFPTHLTSCRDVPWPMSSSASLTPAIFKHFNLLVIMITSILCMYTCVHTHSFLDYLWQILNLRIGFLTGAHHIKGTTFSQYFLICAQIKHPQRNLKNMSYFQTEQICILGVESL